MFLWCGDDMFFSNDQCVKSVPIRYLGEMAVFFCSDVLEAEASETNPGNTKKTETQDLYQHLQVGVPNGC